MTSPPKRTGNLRPISAGAREQLADLLVTVAVALAPAAARPIPVNDR